MKHYSYILIISLLFPANNLLAQKNATSVSIKAKAEVIEKAEIELVTIKDMDIDANMAIDGKIHISAKQDANAGVLMVKGKAEAYIHVTFIPDVIIYNSTGKGELSLHYEVNGYPGDNQGASEPIDAAERKLQISSESKYYFWLGGYIDISKAQPGKYDGEFTLEIEYI